MKVKIYKLNRRLPAQSHGNFTPAIFNAALFTACDAFNARTMTIREYHYTDLYVIAHKMLSLYYDVVFIALS